MEHPYCRQSEMKTAVISRAIIKVFSLQLQPELLIIDN